jgi:hypothetical protein
MTYVQLALRRMGPGHRHTTPRETQREIDVGYSLKTYRIYTPTAQTADHSARIIDELNMAVGGALIGGRHGARRCHGSGR